jgi:hypothetical protein
MVRLRRSPFNGECGRLLKEEESGSEGGLLHHAGGRRILPVFRLAVDSVMQKIFKK